MPEEAPAPPAPGAAPETAPAAPEKAPEEEVLLVSRTSRRAYLLPYLIGILLIVLPLPFTMFLMLDILLDPFVYIVLGIIVLALMEIFIRTRDELRITDRAVTERRGVLSKHITTVDYNDISAITVKQGASARLLGYGELSITVKAKTEPIKFSKIGSPEKVKETMEEQIRKVSSAPRAPAYPAAPPAPPAPGT